MNERQLTTALKNATDVACLIDLARNNRWRLNSIHIATFFRKLASIVQGDNLAQAAAGTSGTSVVLSAACQELVCQLQVQLREQHCSGQGPRGLANIMAALAKLHCTLDAPLLPLLLECFCAQLIDAEAEDISNVLWGASQLTLEHACLSNPDDSRSTVSQYSPAAMTSADAASLETQQAGVSEARVPHAAAAAAGSETLEADAVEGAAAGPHVSSDVTAAAAASSSSSSAAAEGEDLQQAHADFSSDVVGAGDGMQARTPHTDQQYASQLQQHQQGLQQQRQEGQQHPSESRHLQQIATPLISQQQMKLMLLRLCDVLDSASSQSISNVAWSLAQLQSTHNWCMCGCLPLVRRMATHLTLLPVLLPRHVQNMLHCMIKLGTACSQHAAAAWVEWQPPLVHTMLQRLLGHGGMIKQHHVASLYRDLAQLGFLCLSPEAAAEALEAGAAAAARYLPDAASIWMIGWAVAPECTGTPPAAAQHRPKQQGADVTAVDAAPAKDSRTDRAEQVPVKVTAAYTAEGLFAPIRSADSASANASCSDSSALASASTGSVATAAGGSLNGREGLDGLHANSNIISSSAAATTHIQRESIEGQHSTSSSGTKLDAKGVLTSKAAARAAASAAVLARVQPQLQRVGLLGLYQQLSSMYPRGTVANFRPVVGTAVTADVETDAVQPTWNKMHGAATQHPRQQQQQQQGAWMPRIPQPPARQAAPRWRSERYRTAFNSCSNSNYSAASSSAGSSSSSSFARHLTASLMCSQVTADTGWHGDCQGSAAPGIKSSQLQSERQTVRHSAGLLIPPDQRRGSNQQQRQQQQEQQTPDFQHHQQQQGQVPPADIIAGSDTHAAAARQRSPAAFTACARQSSAKVMLTVMYMQREDGSVQAYQQMPDGSLKPLRDDERLPVPDQWQPSAQMQEKQQQERQQQAESLVQQAFTPDAASVLQLQQVIGTQQHEQQQLGLSARSPQQRWLQPPGHLSMGGLPEQQQQQLQQTQKHNQQRQQPSWTGALLEQNCPGISLQQQQPSQPVNVVLLQQDMSGFSLEQQQQQQQQQQPVSRMLIPQDPPGLSTQYGTQLFLPHTTAPLLQLQPPLVFQPPTSLQPQQLQQVQEVLQVKQLQQMQVMPQLLQLQQPDHPQQFDIHGRSGGSSDTRTLLMAAAWDEAPQQLQPVAPLLTPAAVLSMHSPSAVLLAGTPGQLSVSVGTSPHLLMTSQQLSLLPAAPMHSAAALLQHVQQPQLQLPQHGMSLQGLQSGYNSPAATSAQLSGVSPDS